MHNIYLIGYRCTGKTSIGRMLSEKLKWKFIDADIQLVKECGTTIAEMVSQHGWPYFREQERKILQKLIQMNEHVVATGGGVILNPDNVEDMKNSGTVIWLRATPETVKKRIFKDTATKDNRPSLTDKGLSAEIEHTLAEREPLYTRAADFYIDTDNFDVKAVCLEIESRLK